MIRCTVYGFGLGAIALFVSILCAPPASANACLTVYALVSIKQQKENETKQCGFSSNPQLIWSKDRNEHLTWCQQQTPQTWRAALEKRQEMLNSCG